VFRAGTYPGETFGLQEHLLGPYRGAAKLNKLQNIIEVLDYRDLNMLDQYAACYQVGCRQQQNYTLLREVGRSGKPVFLKRHPASTIDELLGSAEYILAAGCKELYIIERGSVGVARHVRWDLSISLIPAIQAITGIPVIVDASHGTGRRDLVSPMTMAGVAAGANGVLIECHPDPKNSLSDADQAITLSDYGVLMTKINKLREVLT
jgi:3-deoxy-7-phosphoheptulonate synthase